MYRILQYKYRYINIILYTEIQKVILCFYINKQIFSIIVFILDHLIVCWCLINEFKFVSLIGAPFFGTDVMPDVSHVVMGQNTSILCNVTSIPASNLSWSYDSAISGAETQRTETNGDYISVIGILEIFNAQYAMHEKTVTCKGEAMNRYSISQSTTLHVKGEFQCIMDQVFRIGSFLTI